MLAAALKFPMYIISSNNVKNTRLLYRWCAKSDTIGKYCRNETNHMSVKNHFCALFFLQLRVDFIKKV